MHVDFYHYPNERALTPETISGIAAQNYDAVSLPMHITTARNDVPAVETYVNSELGREIALTPVKPPAAIRESLEFCESGHLMALVAEPRIIPPPDSYVPDDSLVVRPYYHIEQPRVAAEGMLQNVQIARNFRASLPGISRLVFNAVTIEDRYSNVVAYGDAIDDKLAVSMYGLLISSADWRESYANLCALRAYNTHGEVAYMQDNLLNQITFMSLTEQDGRLAVIDLYDEDIPWTRAITDDLYRRTGEISDVTYDVIQPIGGPGENPRHAISNQLLAGIRDHGVNALPELTRTLDPSLLQQHCAAYIIAVICEGTIPELSNFTTVFNSALAEVVQKPDNFSSLVEAYDQAYDEEVSELMGEKDLAMARFQELCEAARR